MREFLIGIAVVVLGIHLAVWPSVAVWMLLRPAQSVTVSLDDYDCALTGKVVKCERK